MREPENRMVVSSLWYDHHDDWYWSFDDDDEEEADFVKPDGTPVYRKEENDEREQTNV